MLIVSAAALQDIQAALVSAMHAVTDHNGDRVILGTIDSRRLEAAAKAAITVVVGETVWPADQKITIPRPKQAPGPFVQDAG